MKAGAESHFELLSPASCSVSSCTFTIPDACTMSAAADEPAAGERHACLSHQESLHPISPYTTGMVIVRRFFLSLSFSLSLLVTFR